MPGFWSLADFLVQPYVRLSVPLRVARPGEGVQSAEEWGRDRVASTAGNADRYDSDEAYGRYLDSIRESKLRAVESLMEAFDFGRYPRVLELGCGDMPQAAAVAARFPGIRYTATDFDPVVIERCGRISRLASIRKAVVDASRPGLDLSGQDLLVSWSLEFALDDAALTRLFAACKAARLPYLLGTHTAIGPIGWWRYRPRGPAGGMRHLGWLRSAGEVERIARGAGMRPQWRRRHANHVVLFFEP